MPGSVRDVIAKAINENHQTMNASTSYLAADAVLAALNEAGYYICRRLEGPVPYVPVSGEELRGA